MNKLECLSSLFIFYGFVLYLWPRPAAPPKHVIQIHVAPATPGINDLRTALALLSNRIPVLCASELYVCQYGY